jgi:hypothetical protein
VLKCQYINTSEIQFANKQVEVSHLAGPKYQCHCLLPYILALTPYRDVFVTIGSNLISAFVVAHDVTAVLLGVGSSVCLFVASRRISL